MKGKKHRPRPDHPKPYDPGASPAGRRQAAEARATEAPGPSPAARSRADLPHEITLKISEVVGEVELNLRVHGSTDSERKANESAPAELEIKTPAALLAVAVQDLDAQTAEACMRQLVPHVLTLQPVTGSIKALGPLDRHPDGLTVAIRASVDTSSFAGKALVALQVQSQRAAIEASGTALLSAVATMASSGLVPPKWMSDALAARLRKVRAHDVGSLDEAFDHIALTPRELGAAKTKDLLPAVETALTALIREDPDRPIDVGLFEEAGQVVGVKTTTCSRLYYEALRTAGIQDLTLLKQVLQRVARDRNSGDSVD